MKALATEMVSNFSKKLSPIGISVKECTGDMQLTKKEIAETQMLVTTPEKWDVITRKGAGIIIYKTYNIIHNLNLLIKVITLGCTFKRFLIIILCD